MEDTTGKVDEPIGDSGSMANNTILISRCSWNVIPWFRGNNHIVMTGLTIVGHTEGNVIIVSGRKRTTARWGMTGRAIHRRNVERHVIGVGQGAGSGAVTIRWRGMTFFTGLRGHSGIGMIDIKWRIKCDSVMTGRAILGANIRMGYRIQRGQISGLARCIDAVCRVIIVTGFTLKHGWVDQTVREDATHAKAIDAMAGATILDRCIHPGHDRMSDGLIRGVDPATGRIVARIATCRICQENAMVRIGRHKSRSRVAVTAIASCVVMNNLWSCFPNRSLAVMTPDATGCNTGMVKGAIRVQIQEGGGVMTLITLTRGRLMEFGFTDGDSVIVTGATDVKNLLVIYCRQQIKPEGGVTALTQVSSRGVHAYFSGDGINRWNLAPTKSAVMTVRAL